MLLNVTQHYDGDDTGDNVKSVTVTWPCLFQQTTHLAHALRHHRRYRP